MTGEEKHQLIAYRREIKELKQSLESSRVRQQEAELIALQYQRDIAELRKQGDGEKGREGEGTEAIALLQDAIKIKNPTIRKLKSAIRKYLTNIGSSTDSRMASRDASDTWEDKAMNFLDDFGNGDE